MERRNFIAALVAVPVIGLLAACGSDDATDSLQTSDTTAEESPADTAAPSTQPAAAPSETEVPAVLSDEPVLSYTTPGGFTTREFAFQNPPTVLLTRDGTLIEAAVPPAIFPGPLLPQHQAQTVSPVGIDALLASAESVGLLADVDYTSEDGLLIADAPTATLTISADGTTYTHEAYALGVGGGPGEGGTESTPQRQALLDFLTALRVDPASIIGVDNLSAPIDYEPVSIQLIAMPVNDLSGFDPAPTVQPWPAESSIELATATDCVEADSAVVVDLLDAATQLTFFSENDVTYQVTARPAYPGRSC
jgi:hypothetical protein